MIPVHIDLDDRGRVRLLRGSVVVGFGLYSRELKSFLRLVSVEPIGASDRRALECVVVKREKIELHRARKRGRAA